MHRKPATAVRPQQRLRVALSRSDLTHFMIAKACIGVAELATIDDNFDNIDWLDSIDVSYNPPNNQTTYKARDTIAAKYSI